MVGTEENDIFLEFMLRPGLGVQGKQSGSAREGRVKRI